MVTICTQIKFCFCNLLINGGFEFETGDFTGWTEMDQAGSGGSFYVVSGTTTPDSGATTVGAF